MKYKDKRDNKAYDNFGMREDEINNLLTYCKSKRKELESNTDDLSIRREEKMKKKEYGDAFKKVIVASLSLAATGAIIVGTVMYNNGNSSNDKKNVAKASTTIKTEETTEIETEKTTETESKKIEKSSDDSEKGKVKKSKIKLNKEGQVEFKMLFGLADENGLVEESSYKDKELEVGDYVFKWNSTTDKYVYARKKNEKKFAKLEGVKLFGGVEGNYFYTDGKEIFFDYKDSIYRYDLETNKREKITIPEKIKNASVVKPSDHICNIYKGVIYISETDLSKMSEHADETYKLRYDTYVYDISTGKMDLLEKGLGYDVLVNDYIVLDEFTEDSSVFVRVYLKKITDEGLETVKKFDDGYEVAQCDPDKKIITFSTVCEDGYTYWDEDKAIEFDTKTGKFIKGVK